MTEKSSDKRVNKRYESEANVSFHFLYDIATKLKFENSDASHDHKYYQGVSKNISVDGLCFVSDQETRTGDELNIQLFLPRTTRPIELHGQVCWCHENQDHRYETGVHIDRVEDKPVEETIYYDETYHVEWSEVLESVLGKYRILSQTRRNKNS